MNIAILTANLGNFDTPIDPTPQVGINTAFHRFTDADFPPVSGLTPRLQYRIPKLFGWEMFPNYDYYIWLDGSITLTKEYSALWLLSMLDDNDIAFFTHPNRQTVHQEVDHIEEKLEQGNEYIVSRYNNGFHKEMLDVIEKDKEYLDVKLFASTAFIYRNNSRVHNFMESWWFYQSRYYTCDQVCLPWVLQNSDCSYSVISDNVFKNNYIELVSHHK